MCVKPIYVKSQGVVAPCGFCFLCRQRYRFQWAARCVHEASLHEENCFGTLTYDDEHLPEYGSLVPRHFQLFMKRLRKSIEPKKVRFYHAGEYGGANYRPHYHFLLFGHMLGERSEVPTKSEHTLWRSGELARVWTLGLSAVGAVSFESAAYVAGYVMKKAGEMRRRKRYSLEPLTGEVHEIQQEYSTMSRGGDGRGLGAGWWDKYGEEVSRLETVRVGGREATPPRYYDELLRARDSAAWEVMKLRRERKHGRYVCTNERMAREIIARKRLEMTERRL